MTSDAIFVGSNPTLGTKVFGFFEKKPYLCQTNNRTMEQLTEKVAKYARRNSIAKAALRFNLTEEEVRQHKQAYKNNQPVSTQTKTIIKKATCQVNSLIPEFDKLIKKTRGKEGDVIDLLISNDNFYLKFQIWYFDENEFTVEAYLDKKGSRVTHYFCKQGIKGKEKALAEGLKQYNRILKKIS